MTNIDAQGSPAPPGRPIRFGFVVAALFAPILVPPIVYLVVALVSGLGPAESVGALIDQGLGGRPNPLVAGLLGLLPALFLLAGMFLATRLAREAQWIRAAGWGGLGALLIVLAWANFEAWPLFLPGMPFPGFPHGIELVIAPLFFGPIAILIGAAILGILARMQK